MKISERILEGIKTALTDGQATVKVFESAKEIKEASNITGSGSGIGGRVYFDDAFAAARYLNPFRMGARQVITNGSDAQFVAKTGNATNIANPWGYSVTADTGTPATDTTIWQLPMRIITAQLPIRTAILGDVNNLDSTIVSDLMAEFSQVEASSMALNNDQSGSTTTATGATSGLRGLKTYNTINSNPPGLNVAAYGTSGTSITSGIHTILTWTMSTSFLGTNGAYNYLTGMASSLPAQYWAMEGTAWHMHPSFIWYLRNMKGGSSVQTPQFVEVGDSDGGAGVYLFGFPVIPNPYLGTGTSVDDIPCVLANWPSFMTIADNEDMTIKLFDETSPGFVVLYGEKRMASTIRDPFAGVFMKMS